MTKEAQEHYIIELTQAINMSKDHCVLGYLYWDPIYLDRENCGWAEEKAGDTWKVADNVTANSTIFDFNGKALPVFDAIKYNK
jgi:arabinogalactan endo-1,4-beta-galactosidase